MSAPVLPRRLAHRGSVEAAGLVVDPALIGEPEARSRIIAQWRRGCRVHQIDGLYVLLLDSPRRVVGPLADGVPLVVVREAWLGLPLDEAEQRRLRIGRGDVVIARGGEVVRLRLRPQNEVDPATWIDVDGFRWPAVNGLGPAPAPPPLAVEDVQVDVRGTLLADIKGGPDAPAERTDVIAALRARGERGAAGAGEGRAQESAWGRFTSALSRLFGDSAAHRIMRSPLGRALGHAQAAYLQKMVDLFEKGDLDQALRHAVGLGGGDDGAVRPSVGVPSPRSDLRFGAPSQGGSALFAGTELFDFLRQTYRSAFERLKAAGRVREAAFVLVELLGEVQEAVRYLEQEGRLVLAAEIAEMRGLPPGLVVRQWWLAGRRERALAIAKRSGAFHDAALRLTDTDPVAAGELLAAWATALAHAGDYVSAAGVLARSPLHIEDAVLLLRVAVEVGGVQAARALPKLLVAEPSLFEQCLEEAMALLGRGDAEGAAVRTTLARAVLEAPPTAELAALARPTLRALLRDRARGLTSLTASDVGSLARKTGSEELRTDLPSSLSASVTALAEAPEPLTHACATHDRGALPAEEAAMLEGGRFLVALGEAGVRLLDPDGEVLDHYDVPAERLVLVDGGATALACARRGRALLVSRIDLRRPIPGATRARPWIDLEADSVAPWSDGLKWMVASGDEVRALDLEAPRPRALWRVGDVGGGVQALRASPRWVSFFVPTTGERWSYEAGGLVLRHREVRFEAERGDLGPSLLTSAAFSDAPASEGAFVVEGAEGPVLEVGRGQQRQTVPLPHDTLSVDALAMEGPLVVAAVARVGGAIVQAWAGGLDRPRLVLRLRGSTRARARIDHGFLVVVDDAGRLLSVDLARGVLARDLRLRL